MKFGIRHQRTVKKFVALICAASSVTTMFSPIAVKAENEEQAENTHPVTWMEYNKYDKPVLMFDDNGDGNGTPFFFNGVQIRDDKIQDRYHYSDEMMANVYQQAADDGFTVANSQIHWDMVQPDQNKDSIKATYIKGGTNSDTSYGDFSEKDGVLHDPEEVDKVPVFYDPDSADNNAVTYLQYDFNDVDGDNENGYAATKIRLYISELTGEANPVNLHMYGIKNNDWDANSLTWDNAPLKLNEDGTVTGTDNSDYVDIGTVAFNDTVTGSGYYDIDVTDFVNECYTNDRKASFMIAVEPTDCASGFNITLDNDNNWVYFPENGEVDYTYPFAPILTISRSTVYNYEWVDKIINWADDADLKLEFLWFGTDTTKITSDGRVPYYVIRNYQHSIRDGVIQRNKTADSTKHPGSYNPDWQWWFFMCKNDPNLQLKEYESLKALYDHIAEDSQQRGKRVVVGCDISNESATTVRSGRGRCSCDYCNEIFNNGDGGILTNSKYTSEGLFNYDTYWRWVQNLGKAVKDSNYSVWTRINQHSNRSDFVYRNENAKANGTPATYVDFVGYDPYIASIYEAICYGTGLIPDTEYDKYNYGNNLPMAMENSGTQRSLDYYILGTIAGGGVYNVYNMLAKDGNDLYSNKTDENGNDYFEPTNSNIENIRKTNHWLKGIWSDIATKQPENAGGSKLIFFNEWADATANINKYVGGIKTTYKTDNKGVGIAIEESDKSFILSSKQEASFTLSNIVPYQIESVEIGSFDENNNWVVVDNKDYTADENDVIINMEAYETVRITVKQSIPDMQKIYSVNEPFETEGALSEWNIEKDAATMSIADKPGELDRSARIYKTSSKQEKSSISKSFDPISGKIIVKSMLYYNPAGSKNSAPVVYDSNGNIAAEIVFDSDMMIKYAAANNTMTSLKDYEVRGWYQIELQIDTDKDTCDVYIQGQKLQSNLPLKNKVDDIAKIEFCEEGAVPVTMFINEVQVYQEQGPSVKATKLELDRENIDLEIKGHTTLIPSVMPEEASEQVITWTSSDENVAVVDENGKVTAKSLGTAVITASTTDGSELTATCEINVVKNVPVTGVILDKSKYYFSTDLFSENYKKGDIIKGNKVQINANVTPSNASNKKISGWISSNENVATVDKNGLVTAVAPGDAIITAISDEGAFMASCNVYVPALSESFDNREIGDIWGFTGGGISQMQAAVKGLNDLSNVFSISNTAHASISIGQTKKFTNAGDKISVSFNWNVGQGSNSDNPGYGLLRIEDGSGLPYIAFQTVNNQTLRYGTDSTLTTTNTTSSRLLFSASDEAGIANGAKESKAVSDNGFNAMNTTYNLVIELDMKNKKIAFTITNLANTDETVTVSDIPFSDGNYDGSFGYLRFVNLKSANGKNTSWNPYIDNFNLYSYNESDVDTQAPVWNNGNLTASGIAKDELTLNWNGASDNKNVAGYKIYQGDTLINTVGLVNSYTLSGLTANTSYSYKVEAFDMSNNESTDGPTLTVSTTNDEAIGIVEITDIDIPVSGAAPDKNGICKSNGVKTSDIDVIWDDNTTTFGYGIAYTAVMTLAPNEGYAFTNSTEVTVNGNVVTEIKLNEDGTITVFFTFPKTELNVIERVDITGITEPVAQAKPTAIASCVSNGVKTNSPEILWSESPDTFAYNKKYTAAMTLEANDTYGFTDDTIVTVNGKNANKAINEDGTLTVTYEFPATQKKEIYVELDKSEYFFASDYFSKGQKSENAPTIKLTATTNPAGENIIWTSSDETIANVDNDGVVTAVSSGVAVITAEAEGGYSENCVVYVPTVSESLDNGYIGFNLEDSDKGASAALSDISGNKVFAVKTKNETTLTQRRKIYVTGDAVSGEKIIVNFDWNVGSPKNGTGVLAINSGNDAYLTLQVPSGGNSSILAKANVKNAIGGAITEALPVANDGFDHPDTTYRVELVIDNTQKTVGYKITNIADISQTVSKTNIPFSITTKDGFDLIQVWFQGDGSGSGYNWTTWIDNVNVYNISNENTVSWTDGKLEITDIKDDNITLKWSGASANALFYNIYQNDTLLNSIAASSENTYKISRNSLTGNDTFKVEAGDSNEWHGSLTNDGPDLKIKLTDITLDKNGGEKDGKAIALYNGALYGFEPVAGDKGILLGYYLVDGPTDGVKAIDIYGNLLKNVTSFATITDNNGYWIDEASKFTLYAYWQSFTPEFTNDTIVQTSENQKTFKLNMKTEAGKRATYQVYGDTSLSEESIIGTAEANGKELTINLKDIPKTSTELYITVKETHEGTTSDWLESKAAKVMIIPKNKQNYIEVKIIDGDISDRTAAINIENHFGISTTATVVLAVYDDAHKLICVETNPMTLNSGNNEIVFDDINISSDNYSANIMVWDSVDGMMPLCEKQILQ